MKKIKLINVRLSYPSLFKVAVFNGEEGKYQTKLLLDVKDVKAKAEIDAEIAALIKEANIKVPSDKYAIKAGADEYDGYWVISASSPTRPTVIDKQMRPIVETDGTIYGGCYVNAVISFWIMNNSYGKRVCCNILGVQFVKDGERFGGNPVDVMEDFEVIADDISDL